MSDNFSIHDTMLPAVSFSAISLMLRNTRPEELYRFHSEVKKMMDDLVEDAMHDMELHWAEIWADAFPDDDEKPLENAPGWDSERLEKLAWDIYNYLRRHEMWIDICVYFDGKRMSTARKAGDDWEFRYNGEPFIEDGFDPRDYFEYAMNPHIISMSFEGPFYNVVNGYSGRAGDVLMSEFEDLLMSHGLYMELGDAWNASLAEV